MSLSFGLIVISAVFHAVWNMLVKVSDDKVMYNVHIQISTAFFITIYTVIFYPNAFYYHQPTVIYALLSSFFFSLYQHFTAVSYKYADVSMVYPVTTSSPLFIVIWAYFILDERVSLFGVLGILLVLAGCYIMNITKSKGDKKGFYGILIALLAAFLYSFGAMADKMGVGSVNTHLYIMLMADFMSLYSVLFTIFSHRKARILHKKINISIQWKLVIFGGLAMGASTVTYRLGLIDMQISYASALRQISSFFGVLMGLIFLKESYGLQRIIGSIVIITGIVLIRLNL